MRIRAAVLEEFGQPLVVQEVDLQDPQPGEVLIRKGDQGSEMYVICRGEVDVIDGSGQVRATLHEGDCFGEVALLLSEPRTATVRAKTLCNLFVLDKSDFSRILREHQQFAQAIELVARDRYNKTLAPEQLVSPE